MKKGYIYIIHTREFISLDKDIYKIGRTKNINQRFDNYPKGSVLLFLMATYNELTIEKEIIELFSQKFDQKTEIGKEYFKGNINEMIKLIKDLITNNNIKFNGDIKFEKMCNLPSKNNIKNKKSKIYNTAIKTAIINNINHGKLDDQKMCEENNIKNAKYICDKCEKVFKQKCHYQAHLKKKIPCDKITKNEDNIKIDNDDSSSSIDQKSIKYYLNEKKCGYCLKKFTRKDNIINHIKNHCKIKKIFFDE